MTKSEREQAMHLIRFLESENKSLRMNIDTLRMDINSEVERLFEESIYNSNEMLVIELESLKHQLNSANLKIMSLKSKTKKSNSSHLYPQIIKTQEELIKKYQEELIRLNSPLVEEIIT